ncbi:MAG TPA: alpha-amylase/4-alpha-glucanotransferase domain-containing protein [Gemmatimonadales bacterium]|nr:alpha-amylase/4-alpha-glucanotransferase domain-containing protein [Gemmatimonadales bacterium]
MDPVRLVFGVHFHQPVGNFDHVLEAHVRDVYQPFLERLAEREFFPLALHVSGPLLEWLESHASALVDRIGSLAAEGKVELLLSGFYEPVLISLPRQDRIEQVSWMREAIRRRFGVEPTGLWLTERVWEPDLAADLADAGVRYALVDDRHFLVSGFPAERLHQPYWTESDGRRIALLPIHERLRYLVPFKPPADTVAYLHGLRAARRPLAVLVDDGEKFGGWPGTKDWVYERGWLREFLDAIQQTIGAGEVRLTTPAAALAEVPSAGLAYLPTASYREMEAWSLPPAAATRLAALEQELGPERLAGPEGALVRGGHWRHFLVKYPEAGRMHRKMLALSGLSRRRGDPPAARRAIGRAQCNDAYWHGVFGGLYLPHLRHAVWEQLAAAERVLRRGEPPAVERFDVDGDGAEELWAHSASWSVLVSPARGGAIEDLTLLDRGVNLAAVLTRRREPYHNPAGNDDAVAIDGEDRVLSVERVLPDALRRESYERGDYVAARAWSREPFTARADATAGGVEIVLRATGLGKRYRLPSSGPILIEYRWDVTALGGGGGWFAPELSLAHPVSIRCVPEAERWEHDLVTVSKSERGLEQTVQGRSVTVRWPIAAGEGRIELVPDA